MDLKRLEGWSAPVDATVASSIFYFNAPGVTLANFNANRHEVYLAGNFNDACLTNSQIDFLQLHAGSFKNFDLADARVKRLALAILDTDLTGLRFPRNLKRVQLNDFYDEAILPAELTTARASEIIAAWNSPAECDALARRILRRVKSWSPTGKEQLLNSRACDLINVLGDYVASRSNREIAALLVMRRNQLALI